ncbi:hypothetical protein [Roseateles amylovorans]|uniref:1-phosphatidylinositol phosphodiesterase n=1 Tax=Roseateles amylovorans TaxID=2978473 RepID=A0ABY6BAZ0_9BURK|nr:hypothetical protein [Roseateles amylovorans]UXH80362.1 hypothetical protein N4261_10990 [Roseateles amylovorans]
MLPCVSALMAVLCTTAKAGDWDYNDAYWPKSLWARDKWQMDWMSTIPDDRPLLKMSLPGTHQSASNGYGGDAIQNQSLSIADQLKAGIRFLDFRCRLIDGSLQFHNYDVWMRKSCASGMADVANFLAEHPKEAVIVSMKQEYSNAPNAVFQGAFNQMAASFSGSIWKGDTPNPLLGKVRGKMVILNRGWDQSSQDYSTLLGANFDVLYSPQMSSNWDLYDRWTKVKSRLGGFAEGNAAKVTFIVGTGGSFPYFAAGGRSSMYGGHLLTGRTTPGWNSSYPDFPRDDCFIGICSIFFKGLNELTAGFLKQQMPTYVGIVVADFPGKPLIDAIIERNASAWKWAGTAQKNEVFIYKNPYTKTVDFLAAKRDGSYGYFPIDGKDNNDWLLLGREFPTKPGAKYWIANGYSNAGDLYVYRNPFSHTIEYFRAKQGAFYDNQKLWLPVDQTSNAYWEIVH